MQADRRAGVEGDVGLGDGLDVGVGGADARAVREVPHDDCGDREPEQRGEDHDPVRLAQDRIEHLVGSDGLEQSHPETGDDTDDRGEDDDLTAPRHRPDALAGPGRERTGAAGTSWCRTLCGPGPRCPRPRHQGAGPASPAFGLAGDSQPVVQAWSGASPAASARFRSASTSTVRSRPAPRRPPPRSPTRRRSVTLRTRFVPRRVTVTSTARRSPACDRRSTRPSRTSRSHRRVAVDREHASRSARSDIGRGPLLHSTTRAR